MIDGCNSVDTSSLLTNFFMANKNVHSFALIDWKFDAYPNKYWKWRRSLRFDFMINNSHTSCDQKLDRHSQIKRHHISVFQ